MKVLLIRVGDETRTTFHTQNKQKNNERMKLNERISFIDGNI